MIPRSTAIGSRTSAQVFSIAKNRIKRLPVWLADMTALKVLKIDHNPLEWPPKEVTVFPLGSTQEVDGPRRNASNRMAEAEEMQRWLPNLIKWFKDEASREPTWNGASRSRDALGQSQLVSASNARLTSVSRCRSSEKTIRNEFDDVSRVNLWEKKVTTDVASVQRRRTINRTR